MPLIDHIHLCNAWDPSRFSPLWTGEDRIGFIREDRFAAFSALEQFMEDPRGGLALANADADPDAAGAALEDALWPMLDGDPHIGPWRGEKLDVLARWGAAPPLRIERCLIPVLGARGFGVHMNAFTHGPDGYRLWTAKRSMTDRTFPGMLDHMVAGGVSTGYGVRETMVKEAWEEAGVDAALAETAIPTGVVNYICEASGGLREDLLFCYDLETPADFQPRAIDGEVAAFDLRPATDVIDALRDGGGYKFNVPLVIIDFAIRRGLITPESEADYAELVKRLRATT